MVVSNTFNGSEILVLLKVDSRRIGLLIKSRVNIDYLDLRVKIFTLKTED